MHEAHRAGALRHLARGAPLLRCQLNHILFTEEFRLMDLERIDFINSYRFPTLIELS